MAPSVLWSLAADQFIVDRAGKFSIIGVWEHIFAASFPAVHPILFVVTAWMGDPNTMLMTETRIWTPGQGLLMTTGAQPFQLSPAGKGLSVNQFFQVQFAIPGQYRIEAVGNGVSAYHFDVTVQALSQGQIQANAQG